MPNRLHITHAEDCPPEGWDSVEWNTLFSSDRTPTSAITQGVVELLPAPPDDSLLHSHGHAETYYVLSGTGLLQFEDEDFRLEPGLAVFIPGGAPHAAWATGTEPLRILYTFAADIFDEVNYEFTNGDRLMTPDKGPLGHHRKSPD